MEIGLSLSLTSNKGVGAYTLTLNRQPIRLNGQPITLTQAH